MLEEKMRGVSRKKNLTSCFVHLHFEMLRTSCQNDTHAMGYLTAPEECKHVVWDKVMVACTS